jgi:Fe-S-cluster containining protein
MLPLAVPTTSLCSGDQKLIQIVDAALADAFQRSGPWLVCRVGCTQCCAGVFAVNQLDAARLREGLAELERSDPQRAARVHRRVRESARRLTASFPGDPVTGVLGENEEAVDAFESFANDEVCPVLDPETGACDLYAHRPMTCRIFGPPVRSEDGVGICELCFVGATDEEIAACEMKPDPEKLEDLLLAEFKRRTGRNGNTIVAMCLK